MDNYKCVWCAHTGQVNKLESKTCVGLANKENVLMARALVTPPKPHKYICNIRKTMAYV